MGGRPYRRSRRVRVRVTPCRDGQYRLVLSVKSPKKDQKSFRATKKFYMTDAIHDTPSAGKALRSMVEGDEEVPAMCRTSCQFFSTLRRCSS